MVDKRKSNSVAIIPPYLRRTVSYFIGPGRTLTLAVIVLAAFGGGTFAVWRRVERHIETSPDYIVRAEQITITPPPEWVRSDVRAEAFRNASLPDRPLSSLDDDLAERIHMAFMLHPWVAKAKVTKSAGARIHVDIEYRQPVCMVEVATGGTVELLPVDNQGVWLPGEDFSQKQKETYPCLAGIDRRPIQPVGHSWGDARVVDGAAIAAALLPVWQQWKLYRIQCVPQIAAGNRPMYELYTRGGTKIIWGSIGGTATGEPPTEEKIARLQQYAAIHGGLDGGQPLDVRMLPAAKVRS
jgi:hypothetical protein